MAERFGSPIISSDSRQLYKDLPIGTAAPTPEQMARVALYGRHSRLPIITALATSRKTWSPPIRIHTNDPDRRNDRRPL